MSECTINIRITHNGIETWCCKDHADEHEKDPFLNCFKKNLIRLDDTDKRFNVFVLSSQSSRFQDYSPGFKHCSSCKKKKKQNEFMNIEHKTCERCIMRVRNYERKNKKAYFGHMA